MSTRHSNLGALARDVLITILHRPGINGGHLRTALQVGESAADGTAFATTLTRLSHAGYICNDGGSGKGSAWRVTDDNKAIEGLAQPYRPRLGERPWERRTQDPAQVLSARASAEQAAPRPRGLRVADDTPRNPAAAATLIHDFDRHHTGTSARSASAYAQTAALYGAERPPVIRAGSLDALCLPSRRFGHVNGLAPAAHLNADQVAQRLGVTVAR